MNSPNCKHILAALFTLCCLHTSLQAADLIIADQGKSQAVVAVSAEAGKWEKQAAEDLAKYIQLMSGAETKIVNEVPAGTALVVGKLALAKQPELAQQLQAVAKKSPVLRADAVVLKRSGPHVLLAGTNDDSHYYAAAELLRRWGCRWFLPTEFGECIPEQPKLTVGELDVAYGCPFEVRKYWLSWNGDNTGRLEFMRRNMMNDEVVPSGHVLAKYTKALIPAGKNAFNIPISEPETAAHVAKQIAPAFAKGDRIMLGLEDGVYESESARDRELKANLQDKYFLAPSLTDPFLTFYNQVSEILLKDYPDSTSKIGFLAYSNITIPPQRKITAAKPLVAYLAPIDIDPIHGMDDPKSPMRQEYKAMLYRWAEVMQGRVVIYDYDQGMLVWRDMPNPSHQAFQQDVKHYHKAGILGVDTESRGAMATIFLNLYLRSQLLWNPDADVDALLAEFYPLFYGPAAEPMAAYWGAIYAAWENSIVSEHEYFVAPAIYTPELLQTLKTHLTQAESLVNPLRTKAQLSRNEKLYIDRIKFTRAGFEVMDAYMSMVQKAAAECDYAAAAALGEKGLAAREQLTEMNGTFTTYKKIGEHGSAWWPGEVKQYSELAQYTNGPRGQLVLKTPLVWSFRRDPHDTGLVSGWAAQQPDLSWWNAQEDRGTVASHQRNPGHWEQVRTDLYYQAQGVLSADYHPYQGFAWYHTPITLKPDQTTGPVHLMFPGLFNECWLYVNGHLVAHRQQKDMWWRNDYKFQWDVDLSHQLQPGENTLSLRINNPHHFGGIIRRPFLYRANETK